MIPAGAEDALLNAADVIFAIDAEAAQVCPTCTGQGITEIPPPLMAAGGEALDDAQQSLSEATFIAAPAPIKPSKGPKHQQGDGDDANATNPPSSPVSVPPTPGSNGGGSGPSEGSDPTSGISLNVGASGGGGKNNDKDKPDLEEVKAVVDEVVKDVNDAVGGLGDALGGGSGGGS